MSLWVSSNLVQKLIVIQEENILVGGEPNLHGLLQPISIFHDDFMYAIYKYKYMD